MDPFNLSCDPIFEQDDYDEENESGEDFEEFADDCEEFTGGLFFISLSKVNIFLDLTKIFTSAGHTNYRVIFTITIIVILYFCSLIVNTTTPILLQLFVLNHCGVVKHISNHI